MKEGRPLFVYGTLRVGEHNYDMIEEVLEDDPEVNCTTPGSLYFAGRFGYPLAKFTDSRDRSTIKGDLLWCDATSREYEQVCQMEIRAGYELRPIVVTTQSGETIFAYGFHFKHDVDHTLMIRDGDWQRAYHEHEMPGEADTNEDDWEPVV